MTSNVRRLRLLMPTSGCLSLSARSSSAAIVHFYQHRHVQAAGDGSSQPSARHPEHDGDQQNGIGAHRARLAEIWYASTMKSLRSTGSKMLAQTCLR